MFEREENPQNVTKAEIVVGLASYNEADSIAYPTTQAGIGLKKYFGDRSSVILNCDNHSPDDTEHAFLGTKTDVPKIYVTTPPKTPGKGYNFENMFRKVMELDAKVLICLDADLLSVTPEWVKYFAEPVVAGHDFVSPIYSRHKYDGTITNNICFPVVYGLFCRNIRQPIGGDFAMSADFARHVLLQPWHRTTEEYGIDVFLTMNAIVGDFKTCNTGLGAKVHKPSAPKLGPMFIQVVSTAFLTVIRNFEKWRNLDTITEQKLFGLTRLDPPQELNVDRAYIEEQALKSFAEYRGTLEAALSADLYNEIARMFDGKSIDIDVQQWVRIVYDMIVAFRTADDQNALVESMKGLYFGRTLSFMNKTWDWSTEKSEEEVLAQAVAFHGQRDYLVERLAAQDA
ncbi:MAG: glycosyl transferase [Lentisphaerales bacterium]|jgi:glycosyltransferase involved in cell wall biosynthesis|nr:MAG: glycosyl transferase [Lentisphaerales bacterium]